MEVKQNSLNETYVIEQLLKNIASFAMEGMLFEVSATPKPGLVDRNNSGAHHDMDYFTFMSSAAALHNSFEEFAMTGWQYRGRPVKEMLQPLRKSGIRAEQSMFTFTEGVNTHKGMIFTLGMLCGCAGWLLGKKPLDFQNLSACVKELCGGICEKEYADLDQKASLTKGERMYLKYGCTGARGEVEAGYPTVQRISLPVYTKLRKENLSINDALVQTLLYLISDTCDTNILSRHNMETVEYCQKSAKEALDLGGIRTEAGRNAIEKMDEDFIKKYVSPGGCADLLAVTHFIYCMEHADAMKYCYCPQNSTHLEEGETDIIK